MLPILLLLACSKGNEHITRDLYTIALPVAFNFPAITDSTQVTDITEFKGSTNIDSLIRTSTSSQFGTENIESIKISAVKLDVVNSDTTYNFRLLENLTVSLKGRTTTSDVLARITNNSDLISSSLILPVTGADVELKEIFNLYDEELDGKIDGTQIGDVVRAAGLKPTNAMVVKASGAEYKRKGEKRITFEEWLPIYEQLSKEKVNK